MASEWYYQSDNAQVGPYSTEQIRALVKSGTVPTSTPVRKQGMVDWVHIDQIPQLADTTTPAPSGPPEVEARTTPTMMEEAMAAARMAALTAEQKRIELINLPAAYRELGRQCLDERRWADDFPDVYRQLDTLHEQHIQSRQRSDETSSGATMSEKAKAIASKGVEYAKGQQISAQIQIALATLGKEAFAKHRCKAGTDSVTSPLVTLTTRLKEITTEQERSRHSGLHPALVGAAVILFFPLGLYLLWRHPSLRRNRKWWLASACWSVFIMYGAATEPPPEEPPTAGDSARSAVTSPSDASNAALPHPASSRTTISPMPDLGSRVRRGIFESEATYRERIFNRTVIATLEHSFDMPCDPGPWRTVAKPSGGSQDTEYESVVTRADGHTFTVRLREKDYQFVWVAYPGSDLANAIGAWKRDGTAISERDYDTPLLSRAPDGLTQRPSANHTPERAQGSDTAGTRHLPKVKRATWGATTLPEAKRYMLVDSPEKCKGKEYKMEVKYPGGGTRDKNGRLEDVVCNVWTGGNFFQMEFSFPPDLPQPHVKPGDYLTLSFVFSGSTTSLFSSPNVVTAVERPRH